MKKNNGKRNVQFLAAAALTAALMAGQIQPAAVYGSENIQVSSLIPDNVTVEQPVPLSEISLPSSEYGILSWADESSVPSERVQSYDVVFRPYNAADLSKISGWDGSSDVIYSSVRVVVSGIEENESQEEEWSEENNGEASEDQNDSQWEEENSGTGENDSQESEDHSTGSTDEDAGESNPDGQENDGTEFILVRPECGKAVCGQDGEVVAFQQGAATGAGKSGDTWSVCQCDFCHFGRFEEQ